jgi:RHS repeat-associated protein
MVEQTRGSAHTQIVYSPTNQKLALMNSQTLTKAMVPLPGKAYAIYNNSSGPLYYAHPDLLGSIRLATTPARAKYFDTAYAPFGETYASSGTLDAAYTGQMGDLSHRQDTAGGLYDFPAREYSTQGRWPSPDPAGVSATCIKDPQSQNRYAYVRNNPITRIDPNGMDDEGPCGGDDPLCWVCQDEPWLCYAPPSGFGGGGGGVGGEAPKPRTFPWPQLPTFFFGKLSAGLQPSFAEVPGVCLCSYITPITVKLETQQTGCTYICACPGISIARSDPNPRPWCAFHSCPDLTLFRPTGGGRGVFFFGVPVPWCT